MDLRIARMFFISAGAVLIGTSVAKLISACGSQHILNNPDPILGISFRSLFLVASLIEIPVALVCLFSKRMVLQACLIAWLTTVFLVYRMGVLFVGYHRPCTCLGNLTDTMHIPPQVADNIMKGVLTYLIIGSYGILFHLWWRNRKLQAGGSEMGSGQSHMEIGN